MVFSLGANEGARTLDLLITNQLLYQLSYIGLFLALQKPFSSLSSWFFAFSTTD